MKTYIGIALLLGLGALTPAQAQLYAPATHVYTQIDSTKTNRTGLCRTTFARYQEDVVTQRCPNGPGGWPITIAYADARDDVFFGRRAEGGTSVSEAVGGAFSSAHDTIEWRLRGGRPFAAIHRYYLGANERQVLLVHRLQPDKTSCVAAVVAVRKGHDANTEAVAIADSIGETFRCGRDRMVTIGSIE
jgi:formate-dependent nitrite reductase cytochrome c552 subunit